MMAGTAHPEVPALPGDVQWQIVQQLSTRDVCCAAMASKAFWQWSNALTHLEAGKTVKTHVDVLKSMRSLQLFLRRRLPTGLNVNCTLLLLLMFKCISIAQHLHSLLC